MYKPVQLNYCRKVFCVIANPCVLTSVPLTYVLAFGFVGCILFPPRWSLRLRRWHQDRASQTVDASQHSKMCRVVIWPFTKRTSWTRWERLWWQRLWWQRLWWQRLWWQRLWRQRWRLWPWLRRLSWESILTSSRAWGASCTTWQLGNTVIGVLPGSKCLKLMQFMTMSSFEESDVCIQERWELFWEAVSRQLLYFEFEIKHLLQGQGRVVTIVGDASKTPINQSINQPINQWMNQWINQSINQLKICVYIYIYACMSL